MLPLYDLTSSLFLEHSVAPSYYGVQAKSKAEGYAAAASQCGVLGAGVPYDSRDTIHSIQSKRTAPG